MNSRERVKRAVRFETPDRVPIYCFNRDFEASDIVNFEVRPASDFVPKQKGETEWGYVWQKLDDTMGQPEDPVIRTEEDFKRFSAPNARAEGRLKGLNEFIEKYSDKYRMVGPDITGFTIVTFLRGFEDTLMDLYTEEESLIGLIDQVFEYETELIRSICEYDIDAISFHDDWGTQNACFINPELWRKIFKPRYRKQFDLIHSYGKEVFFHSCGNVTQLLDDFLDLGIDILNFNQPEVMGLDVLSQKLQGKIAINSPVDLQKKALNADREEIFEYTRELYRKLGGKTGGFIGYVEEYHSIGLSEENYLAMLEALQKLKTDEK